MTGIQPAARAASIAERSILGVFAGGAFAIAIADIVLVIVRATDRLLAPAVTIPGMPLDTAPATAVLDTAPGVTSAHYDTVTITAEGLSTSPRVLLSIADALSALGPIALCLAVAWLCVRVLVGRPFTMSAIWGIGAAAIAVIGGGLMSQAVLGNAYFEVVDELGLEAAGLPSFQITVDLAPLGWGFALTVIAAAFEIGHRMQKDTEGLV